MVHRNTGCTKTKNKTSKTNKKISKEVKKREPKAQKRTNKSQNNDDDADSDYNPHDNENERTDDDEAVNKEKGVRTDVSEKPKRNDKRKQNDSDDDDDEVVKRKPSGNKKKEVELVECIAIKYNVPEESHPYHHLHNSVDKTPLHNIIYFNESVFKEQLKKGFQIEILKDEFHVPVPAVVDNSFIYKLDIKQVKKSIYISKTSNFNQTKINTFDERNLNNDEVKTLQIESILEKVTKKPDELAVSKVETNNKDNNSSSKTIKNAGVSQKNFTTYLKKQLEIKFPNHPNETSSFYEEVDLEKMLEIKNELANRFVPEGKELEQYLRRAGRSLITKKSNFKRNINPGAQQKNKATQPQNNENGINMNQNNANEMAVIDEK